uniref:Retrotransposon gag domain-containing protein n=1 Tax=Cannabis sativa TaxID=3483 RepID=A0A803NKK7_CANSA
MVLTRNNQRPPQLPDDPAQPQEGVASQIDCALPLTLIIQGKKKLMKVMTKTKRNEYEMKEALNAMRQAMAQAGLNVDLAAVSPAVNDAGEGRSTRELFKKLEPGSVSWWSKLQTNFQRQFVAARKINLEVSALTNIKELPTETLKTFIKRFKEEASKTKKGNDIHQLALLQDDIRVGTHSWNELQQEGAASLTLTAVSVALGAFVHHSAPVAPLAMSVTQTHHTTQSKSPVKGNSQTKNKKGKKPFETNCHTCKKDTLGSSTPERGVVMISRAPHNRGMTNNVLNRYVEELDNRDKVWEVTQLPAQRPRLMDQPIIEEDAKLVHFLHHDPLVIETPIANRDHATGLKECFAVVRKYGMKLNPKKCTFGVKSGKFLGFIANQWGIKANP